MATGILYLEALQNFSNKEGSLKRWRNTWEGAHLEKPHMEGEGGAQPLTSAQKLSNSPSLSRALNTTMVNTTVVLWDMGLTRAHKHTWVPALLQVPPTSCPHLQVPRLTPTGWEKGPRSQGWDGASDREPNRFHLSWSILNGKPVLGAGRMQGLGKDLPNVLVKLKRTEQKHRVVKSVKTRDFLL